MSLSDCSGSLSETDDRDFGRFRASFMDENDRYCETYRRQLKEAKWYECFLCGVACSDWESTCGCCSYEYYFCNRCYEDRCLVLGCGTCCFCLRRLCDEVSKRLEPNGVLPALERDSYGTSTLLALFETEAKSKVVNVGVSASSGAAQVRRSKRLIAKET